MKKIFSVVLAAIMLVSTMTVTAAARGTLIFSDDFNMGFKPANWIQGNTCEFEWDDKHQCIQGYDSAVVLQSNYINARAPKKWDKFYASFDVQIRGFDDIGDLRDSHSVGLWYRDMFEGDPEGATYTYFIEIETGKATFEKNHSFKYRDENNIVQEGNISVLLGEAVVPGVPKTIAKGETAIPVGEKAPWFEIGMRVDTGKIECYYNQQLVFSFEADPSDEKLGGFALYNVDATLGTGKSPILFWNQGNWIGVDNFEVWSTDYDFVNVVYGDVNDDTSINLTDAIFMMQYIAKWTVTINEDAADVNNDGTVNIKDVVKMMQYIAKWDVTLGSNT